MYAYVGQYVCVHVVLVHNLNRVQFMNGSVSLHIYGVVYYDPITPLSMSSDILFILFLML